MLQSLTIQDFRCIERAELEFAPDTNLIIGPNASGKTSLLEAIFFLGRARSFRTARLGPLIRDGAHELMVTGQVRNGQRTVPVGLRRGRRGAEMRLGGQPLRGLADLTENFPVQILDPTVHGLLDGGPRERRKFLDWGVFHVEQSFHGYWQRYSRALKQRNVVLRSEGGRAEAIPWERELAEAGEAIDSARRVYLQAITPSLEAVASTLLGSGEGVAAEYEPGWAAGESLADALARSWERDRSAGSTQVGPHRGDLSVRLGPHRVQDRVSRGQQKVLAGALVLTQLAEYRRRTGRAAALLADDLAAELDPAFLGRFLELAQSGGSQLFITVIRPENLPETVISSAKVFHVEHGVVGAG
ncbi:MAG: DNA replication/repair protein RecF [Xanthomonadaceae bacterium]|nr:DNA replication/repair protein RecF [Xanthomonadaceae bacterium]